MMFHLDSIFVDFQRNALLRIQTFVVGQIFTEITSIGPGHPDQLPVSELDRVQITHMEQVKVIRELYARQIAPQ